MLMPMPRLLTPTSVLTSSSLLLVPSPGLKGGKGGLGSQLKAIGIKVNLGEKIQFDKNHVLLMEVISDHDKMIIMMK